MCRKLKKLLICLSTVKNIQGLNIIKIFKNKSSLFPSKMRVLILTCFSLAIASVALAQSERGVISWYGAEGEIPPGWPTACGEGFDRFAMRAAHKTLPCGTRIRVTNLDNGRTVDVSINDRGPFVPERIIDLTYAAFGQVENHDRGLFNGEYVVL